MYCLQAEFYSNELTIWVKLKIEIQISISRDRDIRPLQLQWTKFKN